MHRKIVGLGIVIMLAACGGSEGSSTSEEATGSGTAGGETVESASERPSWAEMTREQRGQFMAEVVMPAMRPIFQGIDAERYADFSCRTCHGDDARDVEFRMPNGIAPLDPAHIGEIFASDSPMAVAMREQVWPQMGQLLGQDLYNPETHQGFSCFNCHANAGAGH